MRFETGPTWVERLARCLGFLASYAIFTLVLWSILQWRGVGLAYYWVVLIGAGALALGALLRRLLR